MNKKCLPQFLPQMPHSLVKTLPLAEVVVTMATETVGTETTDQMADEIVVLETAILLPNRKTETQMPMVGTEIFSLPHPKTRIMTEMVRQSTTVTSETAVEVSVVREIFGATRIIPIRPMDIGITNPIHVAIAREIMVLITTVLLDDSITTAIFLATRQEMEHLLGHPDLVPRLSASRLSYQTA